MTFRELFASLILMGWINPNNNKELICSPTSFKYNVGIMNGNEDGFVIFDPSKAMLGKKSTNAAPWKDQYYSADEIMKLITDNM